MESDSTAIELQCWNVNNILDKFTLLGVPHFQRGLVWQNDAVSLLLESLFFGTPCGTIILWKTKRGRETEYGLPLQANAKSPRYLIVDGQQRIRSLWNVFEEDVGEEAEPLDLEDQAGTEEEEQTVELEEDAKRTWCMNLGRVPQLAEKFRGGKRFPLFRYAKLPTTEMNPGNTGENNGKGRRPDPTRYDREALFPLYLLNDESAVSRILNDKEDPLQKSVTAVRQCTQIWQQLEQMSLEPLFHVVTLKKDKELREVVEVYNRINSAGKRVEKEERAFANVVFVSTSINKTLADFFDSVHPDVNRQRDAHLARTKERSFGFKLFMRTFVQVWAYHSWRSIGSSGLSFNSVTPDSLTDGHSDDLVEILNDTKNILICIRKILRDHLFCDDLRMLPETKALWPIIQLLIRYPQLQKQQKIVAWLLFRLMLSNASRRTLLDLVAKLDDSDDSKQALEILRSAIGPPPTSKQLIARLKTARSLNNRHTLMLYWILRFKKARDFDHRVNNLKMSGKPKRLAEQCKPSKQHIIPYAYLKNILSGLKRRGRISSHDANDIGNLTYISGEQNGWANLGSRPLKLSEEPLGNRGSHMLDTAANENGLGRRVMSMLRIPTAGITMSASAIPGDALSAKHFLSSRGISGVKRAQP